MDGIKFDSLKEARQYMELKMLKKAGKILDFKIKPVFELQPSFKVKNWETGKMETVRAITYTADFLVNHNGYNEIIDVKGFATDTWKLKWKMIKWKYSKENNYRFSIL